MAVSKVGATAVTHIAVGATSATGTLPNTATANNLLLVAVYVTNNSASVVPTCSTPAGWTATTTGSVAYTLGQYSLLATFYKVAAGGDASPTFTLANTGSGGLIVAEEFSGLAATTPLDTQSTAGSAAPAAGSGSETVNGVTTTNASDWLWAVSGVFCGGATPVSLTWGGGFTSDTTANSAASPDFTSIGTGTDSVSTTGTYTPTISYSASGSNVLTYVNATMAFKQTGGGGGGGGSGHAIGQLFPTPTAISGSDYKLSSTASSAASNSKGTIAALTGSSVIHFTPETTVAAGGTVPTAPATYDNIGWSLSPAVTLGDSAVLAAGSVSVTALINCSQSPGTGTSSVVMILFAGGTEIGRTTQTPTLASGNNTVTGTITYSATTLAANAKISIAFWLTSPTLNTNVGATTVTLTYTATGTNIGSGLAYALTATRSTSDTITGSDSDTRSALFSRTVTSDSVTGNATLTRTTVQTRSESDAVTGTDTDSRALALTRSEADTASASDSNTRATILARTVPDTVTGSDVLSRALFFPRALADAVTGTDAESRTVAYPRTITDSIAGIADVGRAITNVRRIETDNLTTTDTGARVINYGRFTQDGLGDVVNFPTKTLAGVTRDQAGNILGSCTVILFRQSDNFACQVTTSDATTGAYSFARDFFDTQSYYVVSYLPGSSPQVHGVSDRGLTPV